MRRLAWFAVLTIATLCLAPQPASGGYEWHTYGGHSYAITLTAGTWAQSEAEAQSVGAYLVTINDAAENSWLTTFTAGVYSPGHEGEVYWNEIWIGYRQEGSHWEEGGVWGWASGEPVTYTTYADYPWAWDVAMGTHAYLYGGSHPFPVAGQWEHALGVEFEPHYGVIEAQPIPEPSTLIIWSLLASLGIGLGWWRRRKAA